MALVTGNHYTNISPGNHNGQDKEINAQSQAHLKWGGGAKNILEENRKEDWNFECEECV